MAERSPKKPRRARGDGSLTYIKRLKKYQVRYDIGVDENGKRVTKSSYFDKQKDAIAFMQDELNALNRGIYVDPSEQSLYVYCKDWYGTYKEPTITKLNTKKKYRNSLNRIKKLPIGNVQLMDLSTELLQKTYNKMKSDGLSESTIKITHTTIKGSLTHAKARKKIAENYALELVIPKDEIEEEKVKALTELELKDFLKLMERSKYYMLALFMVNTGLRPGEAIALERKDLLTKVNKVRVNKTYVKGTKDNIQGDTKTKTSNRVIPIPSSLMILMKKYMLKQPRKNNSDPLFQTLKGTRITPRNALRQFKAIGERIGCDWVNLHSMRHTFASKLFKEKVDIKVISKLLGHKDVSTTYNIYVHFIDNIVEESVQILNVDLPENLPENRKKKDNLVALSCTTQQEII